jgi:nicotinamidase-related amidase
MRHEKLLAADKCVLLVVDIQEAFAGHISELERVIERSKIMIQAARLLKVPMVVTEQYPKGLGRTLGPIQEALGDCQYYDKVTFSCCQDNSIKEILQNAGRSQVLIVGIETHVCIMQTAYDLLAMNLQPYIAVDAVGSRRESDRQVALQRLQQDGVVLTTTEAAIFEVAVSAKHPAFKEISKLVK